jgi:ribosomal protein S18 acetylase RimI-like enzyme
MEPLVRPATAGDAAVELLYESAQPYYDAYAGSGARARALLHAIYGREGHAASWAVCFVAEAGDGIVGVLAGFPAADGDRLARRFVTLTVPRIPFWRWPAVAAHVRAAGKVAPVPPRDSWYVDALAVDPRWRRRGIAGALLRMAEAEAAPAVSLDTGLANHGARALYEHHGFTERGVVRAPTDQVARAVGGPGFVAYLKAV